MGAKPNTMEGLPLGGMSTPTWEVVTDTAGIRIDERRAGADTRPHGVIRDYPVRRQPEDRVPNSLC
jgi:hypothetical protein